MIAGIFDIRGDPHEGFCGSHCVARLRWLRKACNKREMLRPLKRAVRRTLRQFGWDLRRIEHFGEPTLLDLLRHQGIDLVLDVGANEGQFAVGLRDAGYAGEIVSFEPIPSVYDRLAANGASDPLWSARCQALGDVCGTASILVTAQSVFSSIKPQSQALRDWHSDTAVVRSETIEIATLDQIFTPFMGRRIFLKVDTQGYEQQVLLGARSSLSRIQAVQLELPAIHFYEGVWSIGDAITFVERAGFILAQMRAAVHLPGRAAVAELDCVFRRADPGESVGLRAAEVDQLF